MEEVIDATPDSIRGDEALIERQTGLDVIHTLPAFRSISSDIICLRTAAGWRGIRVLRIEGNIESEKFALVIASHSEESSSPEDCDGFSSLRVADIRGVPSPRDLPGCAIRHCELIRREARCSVDIRCRPSYSPLGRIHVTRSIRISLRTGNECWGNGIRDVVDIQLRLIGLLACDVQVRAGDRDTPYDIVSRQVHFCGTRGTGDAQGIADIQNFEFIAGITRCEECMRSADRDIVGRGDGDRRLKQRTCETRHVVDDESFSPTT